MRGAERADLRNGHLKLPQQPHRFFGAHRLKQGPWREKPLGEEDALLRADALHGLLQAAGVGDDLADLFAQDLGVQQLLAVVPFVEGLRLVLALVALQPQQPPPGRRRQCLGQLRLADTRRPLNEQRLVEPRQQENRSGEALVGDVALAGERVTHLPNGIEHAQSSSSRLPFMQCSTTGRTVSKVHSLALPGVQASPSTWLVIRSTSAASPLTTLAFS